MLSIAFYFSRKQTINDYFLNSKKTGLWLLIFSNVSTAIGAGTLIVVSAETYSSGISFGFATYIALLFGVILLSQISKKIKTFGDKINSFTLVDFISNKYDYKTKNLVMILQLIILIFWIAIQAIAISYLASMLIETSYFYSVLISFLIVITYTTIGGLKLDFISDAIQFWVIFITFTIMAVIGYLEIGSFSNLISTLPSSHFNLFSFGGIGWTISAIVFGGFIYLGSTITWQRIYASKNSLTAKKSFIYSIPFIILFGLIIIFLGLVTSFLYPNISPESSIFILIKNVFPSFLIGVCFAAILSALLSSINTYLISSSTIIYKEIFKNKENLKFAKIITIVIGLLSFLIALIYSNIVYFSILVGYIAISFFPIVFSSIYSKRISSNAVFYYLLLGNLALFISFPFLKEMSFIIVLIFMPIILFYDFIFK